MKLWVVIVVLLAAVVSTTLSDYPAAETPAVLVLNEEAEFAAIQDIHVQLDGNKDGSVDLSESSKFVKTELCGANLESRQGCSSSDKSKRFHQSDKQITSEELWTTWHKNKVINWTTEDVVFWLEHSVGLPQYTENIKSHKITGRHLPQLASNTDQVLQNLLLISNSKHKQKVQLRAMDVVLFGPPNSGPGYWKDAMLALSIALGLCGLAYALRQRHVAQSKIDSFLDNLRDKEKELSMLKEKLEQEARNSSDEKDGGSSRGTSTPEEVEPLPKDSFKREFSQDGSGILLSQYQEENESLRGQLTSMKEQIDCKMSNLQGLLQECSKKEWSHLDSKRKAAEEQMAKAQKVCDKIKKKRNSFLGTLHWANSSHLEEAGQQISKAVNKMHYISECFDEYHTRWENIEEVCEYSIVSTSTPPTHRAPTRAALLTKHHSLLNFPRDDSTFSLNSVGTQSSQYGRASPDYSSKYTSFQRRSSTKSSPEASLDTSIQGDSDSCSDPDTEPVMKPWKREHSPLYHSNSTPSFKKSSLDEALRNADLLGEANGAITFEAARDKKGLSTIREEQQPVTHRKLRKKSHCSEV